MNISIVIIGSFLVLAIILGLFARKGQDMDMEQWAVGGRSFGTIFIFVLLAGEIFTTFTFLGATGFTFSSGMSAIYVFNCFFFIVAYWILPPIWKYSKEQKLLSQSDFYVKKYDSTTLGVIVAIISIIAIIPYLIVQLKGLGIIVSEASYGAISPNVAIFIGVLSVTFYVIISGIRGSAWTAIIKDIMILAVIVFMGIYLPMHYYGGFESMFKAIDKEKIDFLTLPDSGLSTTWFITTTIMLGVSYYMWPHMHTSVYASKSAKSIRWTAATMPIYSTILIFALFIGFAATLQVTDLGGASTDLVLFKFAKMSFDPWLVGFIGAAGALAALVPSSLLLTSAATIVANNVYKVWKPKTTDQQLANITRIFVPIIAIVALYGTFNGGKTISTLYLMAYSLMAQLFPALFFSLFKKNPVTLPGAIVGMVSGVAMVAYLTITNTTIGDLFPSFPQVLKDFDVGLVVVILNIVITLAVSAFTRNYKAVSKAEREESVVRNESLEVVKE
ncbi:sodium:solute symporter family protein [Bacillus massiliigorillae]|uniref:sodium:solute symporter family protein n=1 Tax=Bacillus massiliigorillae TaxID=1243664 RepID=UPI0003A7E777|nr:sodium:solute symporter family protein [Bacillus massiliigorillae]